MDLAPSIFGDYAKNLQVYVDEFTPLITEPQWTKFFKMEDKISFDLTYETIGGTGRNSSAATVMSEDGATPVRSNGSVFKLRGEIPSIKEQYIMSARDHRQFLIMQNMSGLSDKDKVNQILGYLFGGVKNVIESVDRRLEQLCFEGISKGKITLNVTNNPDGRVFAEDFDLGMASTQKVNAAVNWGTAATATPITDIRGVVNTARARGIKFTKMVMTTPQFNRLAATKEVQDLVNSVTITVKGNYAVTLPAVQSMLAANLLPPIELLDHTISIEKNGKETFYDPFDTNNVLFCPADQLGVIHNAIAIEEVVKNKAVDYAKYGKYLVSKYSTNEPVREHTKVEFNGFPGFTTMDRNYLISTIAAF